MEKEIEWVHVGHDLVDALEEIGEDLGGIPQWQHASWVDRWLALRWDDPWGFVGPVLW